jgi:hypothetical protein
MNDSNRQEIPDFATLAADPEIAPLLEFDPARRKVERPDGWTDDLQRELIARIAHTGSPGKACDAMDKNLSGAKHLYRAEGAGSFRQAWKAAIALAASRKRAERAATTRFMDDVPGVTRRGSSSSPHASADGSDHAPHGPRADPLPVICDNCRAEGAAGDETFSAIPDIFAFDPVPRSAHDKLWPAETQRAFIAALAVTGSPVRAARSVGRHAFGAEKLRKARGARAFNEAWEAALDLARERELSRLHGSLSELSARLPSPSGEGPLPDSCQREDESDEEYERRGEKARKSILEKLQRLRRNSLILDIIPNPEKRAAWIVLNGPEEIEAIENEGAQ